MCGVLTQDLQIQILGNRWRSGRLVLVLFSTRRGESGTVTSRIRSPRHPIDVSLESVTGIVSSSCSHLMMLRNFSHLYLELGLQLLLSSKKRLSPVAARLVILPVDAFVLYGFNVIMCSRYFR